MAPSVLPPWLRDFAQTYASCIEQPCIQLCFILAAIHDHTVTIADTKNAFQQSPPSTEACFLTVDKAIQSWYLNCFGILLDPFKDVISVNKALPGHLETDRLWETMITLAGGAVAFESKVQPTISTSSTEAELIAAIAAAKLAIYLRSVFSQLAFLLQLQQHSMKITWLQWLSAMKIALLHVPTTSISSTLLSKSGVNLDTCYSSTSTPPSMLQTVALKRLA